MISVRARRVALNRVLNRTVSQASEDADVIVVVVEANGRILIMARDRAPDLKAILDRLPPGVREI